MAWVRNETSLFVISSRIRVPGDKGPLRVKTQQPPSLKSVVKPSSRIPEITSVTAALATNEYLGALVPVGADSNSNPRLSGIIRGRATVSLRIRPGLLLEKPWVELEMKACGRSHSKPSLHSPAYRNGPVTLQR